MRKYLANQKLGYLPWHEMENSSLSAILKLDSRATGTLSSVGVDSSIQHTMALSRDVKSLDFSIETNSSCIELNAIKDIFLNGTDFENLKAMYEQMYDHNNIKVFRKVTLLEQAVYRGESFRSHKSNAVNSNIVQAKWLSKDWPLRINCSELFARSGTVESLFISKVAFGKLVKNHIILHINWYALHDDMYSFGHHLKLYHKRYCDTGSFSFMPIQRVLSKCGMTIVKHQHTNAVLIIPILGQWAIC